MLNKIRDKLMFFHYGDCKSEISKLKDELSSLEHRLQTLTHDKAHYESEMLKYKEMYNDHHKKFKSLEDNFDRSLKFKDKEHHDAMCIVMDGKKDLNVKHNRLEEAYTKLGIQLSQVKKDYEDREVIMVSANSKLADQRSELHNENSSLEYYKKEYKEEIEQLRKENEKLEAINAEWAKQVEELKSKLAAKAARRDTSPTEDSLGLYKAIASNAIEKTDLNKWNRVYKSKDELIKEQESVLKKDSSNEPKRRRNTNKTANL
jgi:chromosome segregation ATPase